MQPAEDDRPLPRGRHGLTAAVVEASQRQRLRGSALRAVAMSGFADAAVGPIVTAARVSRATFYHLYRTKDELVLEAIEAVLDPLERAMLRALQGAGDPVEATRAALEIRVEHARTDLVAARCLAHLRQSAPQPIAHRFAVGEDMLATALNSRLRLGTALAAEGVIAMFFGLLDRRVLSGELAGAALVPTTVCDLLRRITD